MKTDPVTSFLSANPLSRRSALKGISSGFGYLAFSSLSTIAAAGENNPLAPKIPHFTPGAKRVIFLCMRGGPSHVDTFDYKPRLTADTGKAPRESRGGAKLLGSPWEFKQSGQSGLWISDLFPQLSQHADDLCLIRSMQTDLPNHPQAFVKMHTGNSQFVRPSLGAWTLYGLGTENDRLPGFITLSPAAGGVGGAQNFGSSFLPAIYQGTQIGQGRQRAAFAQRATGVGNDGSSIPNISNPKLNKDLQRIQLDLIQDLNQETLNREVHHPEVEGVIESFELAFRMQDEVPRLMDISDEPESVRAAYGVGETGTDSFARQCLLARRFAEAGVRFIEVGHGNWDHHRNLKADLEQKCGEIDKPIAALLADLRQRDMLKDTLVMWAGEFGRTPHAQNGDGRDHNNRGYTMWMAGGGVKGGFSYGSTDDYGYEAVENPVGTHDWHATILHLLGLNHEKLTYRYAGRDFRLTDVYGNVVKDIIA